MQEIILSAGIDIGTSTTQLIFSRLVMENLASSYTVPRISIVEKEVFYRSSVYFTPLLSQTEIDMVKIKEILQEEYQKAGITPADLKTGAVIITGETARKTNANLVLSTLSNMAGDFVVAAAGPDLESVLSAKGAGTDQLSKEYGQTIANIDIGGGTSNIAVYQNGVLKGTSCLDIGGRLIKIEKGKISYIFPGIRELARRHGMEIHVGDEAGEESLFPVCRLMAEQLAMAVHLNPADDFHKKLYTNQGKPLRPEPVIQGLTISGGVAACMQREERDVFRYGDVGVLLARAVKECMALQKVRQYPAAETLRATVVGAGTHTTEVSGSTISYAKEKLPLKNLPVLKIPEEAECSREGFVQALWQGLKLYETEAGIQQAAIAFSGDSYRSFQQVQMLAGVITETCRPLIDSPKPLVVVLERDIAKALGNALNLLSGGKKDIICIDNIHVSDGDYIDIGEPLADGRVVPVVIKTLIFNS